METSSHDRDIRYIMLLRFFELSICLLKMRHLVKDGLFFHKVMNQWLRVCSDTYIRPIKYIFFLLSLSFVQQRLPIEYLLWIISHTC